MRLKIVFDVSSGVAQLPWNYSAQLQGMVYRVIEHSDPRLARLLHDEGYQYEQRRYKLFVYSLLYGKKSRAYRDGVQLTPPLTWWISSPMHNFLESFASGILRQNYIRIGDVVATVEHIAVETTPHFDCKRVWFRTLSPVVCSTVIDDRHRRVKKFLFPGDEHCERVLEQNLLSKASLLGEIIPSSHFIIIEAQVRSRLFSMHGTNVRAWDGRICIQASHKLLEIAYEAGLGERNAQGFGMIGVIERKNQECAVDVAFYSGD